MFNLADAWGWRPSGTNPCRGVSRFKVEKHERFLTREELYRLGQALRAAPAERLASTHAAAAIRLLVLTGCRRNEIPGLRWDDLNFDTGEMRLRDSKTGARMVPLPPKSHSIVHTPYRLSVALAPFGMRPRLLHQPPRPQSHAAVCGPLRRNAFRAKQVLGNLARTLVLPARCPSCAIRTSRSPSFIAPSLPNAPSPLIRMTQLGYPSLPLMNGDPLESNRPGVSLGVEDRGNPAMVLHPSPGPRRNPADHLDNAFVVP